MCTKNIDISTIDIEVEIDTLPVINKNNIKKVILFYLLFITILLQIIIKIWTFRLLINFYDILNLNNTIIYDDYQYIYYLAISNLLFSIIGIFYCLIIFYIFIYKYHIFKTYKTKIEISITIMWFISSFLSIFSTIIRSKIINKYKKYLTNNCNENNKNLNILLIISFGFFCLSLIIQYCNF
jgi:hypothetical protein